MLTICCSECDATLLKSEKRRIFCPVKRYQVWWL